MGDSRNGVPGRAPRALAAAAAAVTLVTGLVITGGPAGAAPAGQAYDQAAARAAASGWHIQATQNPPSRTGTPAAVSCAAPTACMAVGSFNDGGGFYLPLAEAWNGTSWSVQKPPVPAGAQTTQLLGVSCASASQCEAVGDYRNKAGDIVTLAEVWNGTSWSIQSTPNPTGNPNSVLASVSCLSANACTAAGYSGGFGGSGSVLTLAEAWNGTSWSIQPTPNPTSPNHAYLTSVSCTAPNACMAVGSADGFEPVAEAWNGTSWSLQTPPNPAGAVGGVLSGVSCTSGSACTAVGNYYQGKGVYVLLAEAWNGTSWAIQQAPVPPGATRSFLNGVSCLTGGACTAVGNYYKSATGAHLTLAEAWDGTSWSIQAIPSPPAVAVGLSAVACLSASFCAAVGGQTSRFQVPTPLVEAWNGTSWAIQPAPAPHTATQNLLAAVACPAAADCISVGSAGIDGSYGTLAEDWNGSAWSLQLTPNGPAAYNVLSGLSCVSATACTAVSSYFGSHGGRTMAEAWNGTAWSVQNTPSEPPPKDSSLDAVSCASPTSCVAVGAAGSSEDKPLAEVWNGTSWSIAPVPVPAGTSNSALAGVSCTSPGACVAVGFYETTINNFLALAEVWNGTSWSVQTPPDPAGSTRTVLNAVSCPSASTCTAVGSSGTSLSSQTLAEVWNGTSWSVQPTPNPGGNTSPSLSGVACPSASACTAVGGYQPSTGVPLTLAEVWDGTVWSIQPTPNPAGSDATSLSAVSCTAPGTCTAVGNGEMTIINGRVSSTQTLAEAEP